MDDLSSRLKDLSPEKRALILAKVRQEKAQKGESFHHATAILPVSRGSTSPLSFSQRRLWFLEQMEGENGVYNIQGVYRLTGSLNIDALEASLNTIIQRHESLRTTFTMGKGQPMQVIAPQMKLKIEVEDWRALPALQQESKVEEAAMADNQKPFDLAQGPLLRATVLQLSDHQHVLLFNVHHIVFDAWSMELFVAELARLYPDFARGALPTLPALTLQYADYALWQQQWLTGDRLAQQLNYWRQQLANAPTVLPLPTDYPRPPVQQFYGRTYTFSIPAELAKQLRQLSREHEATMFMTLLSGYVSLLYRYTQQEDILIGTPIANRHYRETEPLIGCFVNTLVLRTLVVDNPGFDQLLAQVKRVTLEAFEHQDLPLDLLVDSLKLERNLSHSPLFQVMFAWQDEPVSSINLADLTITPIASVEVTSKFDLTLSMENSEDGLLGVWEYNTDLFSEATIKRMTGHLQKLLQSIVADPHQSIARLPMLTNEEQHQLRQAWNSTTLHYPPTHCLHHLFEKQVARFPEKVAMIYEEQQLTYQALNAAANQLAHYLQNCGVGPETLVGICVERSLNMAIGLLGILKAGGAYVPIDPVYPAERISFMIADAQVPVLLTQTEIAAKLPPCEAHTICLDADWAEIATESKENIAVAVSPDNLAYVIYTSGSTGKPKGTLVTHYNVTRLFDATKRWYHFSEQDVWSLFHSFAFDFSVWEFWGALLYGGQLVIVPYWVSRSPEAFYELICAQQVTVLNQTPSAFRQLIQAENQLAEIPKLNLRLVIFGGEALEMRSLTPWFERHGDQYPQLVNMYGITETTVHVTYYPLTMADTKLPTSVIGRPIPDLQLYILDAYQQPLPIGIPGEMYVGGAGVSRGYKDRSELTAERFIQHAINTNPTHPTLYRTGDLARYLPNGDIEYLGRIDHQVKLRGFRIELGEIESALVQHTAVQEAVVIMHEDQTNQHKYLVAYLIPLDTPPTIRVLQHFLKDKLPDYMVPSSFIFLDKLPLTTNGKIDRRALPAPDQVRTDSGADFVAPRTKEEAMLAQIWAKTLGIDEISIQDSFFELGGDSILSVQLLAEAKQAGLEFSLQQLFQYQTIYELAQLIPENKTDKDNANLPTPFSLITDLDRQQLPSDIKDAYPLAKLQIGMIFHTAYSPESPLYHNVNSLHIQTSFAEKIFREALQQLVAEHPILRTSFDLGRYSEPLQLVHRDAFIPLQVEDLCHLPPSEQEQTVKRRFESEKTNHFDWTHPPLIRFYAFPRNDQSFQLIFTEHHAILDGWSVASLLTELSQIYLSRQGQGTGELPPAPQASYRDFIALEKQSIEAEEHRQYWIQKVHGQSVTTIPRWPKHYRSAESGKSGAVMITLPDTISARLKTLTQATQVPLKSVLLAAHLRVLSVISNQPTVSTGVVFNGRPEMMGGDRILGLFLNTLPFPMELNGGTWIELIHNIFQLEKEMLPFRRYPLAELQHVLGGQPLFETVFNFVHFHVYEDMLATKEDPHQANIETFQQANFTLVTNFEVSVDSSQITFGLEYDAGELCAEQVRLIGDYYVRALTNIAEQPHERYELAPLLSAQEYEKTVFQWNGTQENYLLNMCAHQLFEAQVEKTPDAVAAIFEGCHLTYSELNERANQLGRYLRAMGIGPEGLVGICMPRSLEMLIGILGILKAGGAYVPLDPTYPAERLTFIVSDASVSILLTQHTLNLQLPVQEGVRQIFIDQEWEMIAQESGEKLSNEAEPANLAYIIYTSGSTGKPKGVMITHEGLVNYLFWGRQTYIAQEGQGAPVHSSIGFDATITGLLCPLISGQTVTLLPEVDEIGALSDVLKRENSFSLVKITPAHLDLLTPLLSSEAIVNQTQTFVIGGEALRGSALSFWRNHAPTVRLINEYGPTETVVGCCTYEVSEHTSLQGEIPIGRPIANMQIYLLNDYLQPVPIGAIGEIYIGGKGVARGYLNHSGLTSERFIPNPFSNNAAERLYKSGDWAYYLPDGNVVFLGRIDTQVKLRGFRIELGEIEATLAQHDSVQEVVVIDREDEPGDKRLVAYLVCESGKEATRNELSNFLKEKLPGYMVPSDFVLIDALPLTPNGKVDREVLPVPDTRLKDAESYVAPRDLLELQLVRIWESILKVHPVGIHDSFFDLGGHSLLAVRLMDQVQQQMNRAMPLSVLFQKETIADLAVILRQQQGSSTWSSLVPIQSTGNHPPFFCVHPSGGNVFCYLDLARYLGPDQPFYGLQARSVESGQQSPQTIEEMATEYLLAIQKVSPQGPYYLGGWSTGGLIAFEVAQQLKRQGLEVALLILIDSYVLPEEALDAFTDEEMMVEFATDFFAFGQQDIAFDAIEGMGEETKSPLHSIWQYGLQNDLFPDDLTYTQAERLFKVFKANIRASQTYRPTPYSGDVLLLRANEDTALGIETLGWERLVTGRLLMHQVPGTHYTMLQTPHVKVVAGKLSECLHEDHARWGLHNDNGERKI